MQGIRASRFINNASSVSGQMELVGDWIIINADEIRAELAEKEFNSGPIKASINRLDVAGALLLKKLEQEFSLDIQGLTEDQQKLFHFLPQKLASHQKKLPERPLLYRGFYRIGEFSHEGAKFAAEIITFIGQVFVRIFYNLLHPRHFRLPSIVRHIQETGIGALPIIVLLALMISLVLFYQGATQLQKFGADIFTIDLTAISILREMGVLVTAIMVAGRSSSAFAAEIGVMKLREEVDALRTMGMEPIEILVIPRIFALLITLPILAFVADIVGLAGGSVMSNLLLDIPFTLYWDRIQAVANFNMFFVGMVKAPVFAFLIAIIGCYQGLNVSSSAESIGRLTTLSVVQAIFLVILADAFFSIVFSWVGL